jgi:hypothetical protein
MGYGNAGVKLSRDNSPPIDAALTEPENVGPSRSVVGGFERRIDIGVGAE